MNLDTNKIKARSLTRLWVVFSDGNKRVFYSIDRKKDIKSLDYTHGIRKLENLLQRRYSGKWKVAHLYENQTNGQLLKIYNSQTYD